MGYKKSIEDLYDNTYKAQKEQIEKGFKKTSNEYGHQLEKGKKQYSDLIDDAYANNVMQERARREHMANMGLSAAGGTSRTIQQRYTNNLNDQVGDIKRQRQDFTDNVKLALSNLEMQKQADLNSLAANRDAGVIQDTLAYKQWKQGYDLQKKQNIENLALMNSQYETSKTQWDAQNKQQKEESAFQHAYNLYVSRLITKDQFEAMTGISVKDLPRA